MSEIPLYENTEEEDWVSEDDAPDGGDHRMARMRVTRCARIYQNV